MQKAAAVEIHEHALRASRIHGAFCVPECRAHSRHDLHTPQDRIAERVANAAPQEDAALRYPQPLQRIAVPAVCAEAGRQQHLKREDSCSERIMQCTF